jgi:hypothetical protein
MINLLITQSPQELSSSGVQFLCEHLPQPPEFVLLAHVFDVFVHQEGNDQDTYGDSKKPNHLSSFLLQ